jgi:ABC-type glycerol-3-phosphate transport system substrate-binding protein
MQPMMDRKVMREVDTAAELFVTGRLSRRGFVGRMLGLGLAVSTAGTVLAACAPKTNNVSTAGAGTLRFLIGPWTDQEAQHQQVIADAFTKTHPGVDVTFKIFDWSASAATTNASLAQNAHDIYYFGEGQYLPHLAQTTGGFADLASRIKAPDFAQEKEKYLYWDRIEALGPRIIGLQVCFHFEDALFVNMDMVKAAGYDKSFVDDWDTFEACLQKMTNGSKTYGLGLGIQLGGLGEWYQAARAAGGRYLSEDLKSPAINTPDVIAITERLAGLFHKGIAPKPGTFDYDTAPDAFIAGRMACYSSDLTVAAVIAGKQKQPDFEWAVLPYPPGVKQKAMYADLGFYAMNSRIANPDLGWDALTWWTGGQYASYWAGVSGTYPARSDAMANGYGDHSTPQLAAAFETLKSQGIGPEPFLSFGTVEEKAEKQIVRVYTGEITAQEAVANVEKIVRAEALK